MPTPTRLEKLKTLVAEAYVDSVDSADLWQRWCYKDHVLVVAKHAQSLAITYDGNTEECVAGALLHDIADAVLDRDNPEHENQSRQIAITLLEGSGYDQFQVKRIIEEIIAPHSCKELLPQSTDAKILATADAIAHLTTNFYAYCAWNHIAADDYPSFKKWVSAKLERDFNAKIFFEEVRAEMKPVYLALKIVFCDR